METKVNENVTHSERHFWEWAKVYCKNGRAPGITLTEPVQEAFEFPAISWSLFSGQSKAGNSNASGTGSVRVISLGLSRSYSKLSPMKIPSTRLTAPGSPRMGIFTLCRSKFFELLKLIFSENFC